MRTFFIFITVFLFSGCMVSKQEYNRLSDENYQLSQEVVFLKKELDDFKFGEDRLSALIAKSYKEKEYSKTKEFINKFKHMHPESKKIIQHESLLKKINAIEEKKKAKELADLNKMGIWEVSSYVDSFGETTNQKFVTTKKLIKGSFSNSATENSKLDVMLLIDNYHKIAIKLYEYAGKNPVKAYSEKKYKVLVKDSEAEKHSLDAINSSDRLILNNSGSIKLYNALLKGGALKFKIYEASNPINQYFFTITDANYFNNASKKREILSKS